MEQVTQHAKPQEWVCVHVCVLCVPACMYVQGGWCSACRPVWILAPSLLQPCDLRELNFFKKTLFPHIQNRAQEIHMVLVRLKQINPCEAFRAAPGWSMVKAQQCCVNFPWAMCTSVIPSLSFSLSPQGSEKKNWWRWQQICYQSDWDQLQKVSADEELLQ